MRFPHWYGLQFKKKKRLPGLAAHAIHPISTGRLEGFNNKIKVAKRIGYGYLDSLSLYSFCPFTIPQKILMRYY
ncbi:transposase [Ruminococcus sp.]|uniref:transposase n=1 Tax=Ruminococcus sp. TaxID=41978 RepID=UPI0025E88CDF|nr:transposase [Ruminococcus sp.]